MIYCTDLDRTLVYSNKFLTTENSEEVIKVSNDEAYPVFMSKRSFTDIMNLFKNEKDLLIIPATTRSLEEYNTIELFKEKAEYAIVCNGAKILHNNIEDKGWKTKIDNVISGYKYYWKRIIDKLISENIVNGRIKYIDNYDNCYFISGKYFDKIKCQRFLEDNIDLSLFYWTIQGKKFYIFPKEIRKENALKYLIDKIKDKEVIVSGDGVVDMGLLNYATLPSYLIVHNDSLQNLNISNLQLIRSDILRIIKNKGIESSDEILTYLKDLLLKKGGDLNDRSNEN